MDYISDWEKRKERLSAFWQREIINRCCIAITAPKKPNNRKLNDLMKLPDNKDDKLKYWTDGEIIVERNRALMENTLYLGESYPHINLNLGASGHAGFFKGVRFQFEESVWFFPIELDWEREKIEFDENSFLYTTLIKLAKYLAAESRGSFIIANPFISGDADALAHLRGSAELLMDLCGGADYIHDAMNRIQSVWIKTIDDLFGIISENNDGGLAVGGFQTWGKGKHACSQCDMSVMISPGHFKEYFFPYLKKQLKSVDIGFYHFDGIEQIRFLDMLLSIDELRAIQWQAVEGQPSPVEYIPYLQKIQKANKGLIIPAKPDEVEKLMTHLSSKGLHMLVEARDSEEADWVLNIVNKLTHE